MESDFATLPGPERTIAPLISQPEGRRSQPPSSPVDPDRGMPNILQLWVIRSLLRPGCAGASRTISRADWEQIFLARELALAFDDFWL